MHRFSLLSPPQRGKGREDRARGKGTPRVSQHPLRAVLRSSVSFRLHVFMLKSMLKTLFSLFLCLLGIPRGFVNLYVALAVAGWLTARVSWLRRHRGCGMLLYPDALPRLGGRSCRGASATDPLTLGATGAASVQPG